MNELSAQAKNFFLLLGIIVAGITLGTLWTWFALVRWNNYYVCLIPFCLLLFRVMWKWAGTISDQTKGD